MDDLGDPCTAPVLIQPCEQRIAVSSLRALAKDLPASRSLVDELLAERQADQR
jgi:hypothetical protein